MDNKKRNTMPEKLKEKLRTSNYYMTSNIKIVTFLTKKGVIPYGSSPNRNNPSVNIYFYGNSSKLRACLHIYYETESANPCK